MNKIRIVVLNEKCTPTRAHPDDAGLDLRAAENCTLLPGERRTIPLGIRVAIPTGYEGNVRPRSGLADKFGISMVNAPGTVDPGYRGEVKAILINHGEEPFEIAEGDRIAQMVIAPVEYPTVVVVDNLPVSDRGENGLGSTGR